MSDQQHGKRNWLSFACLVLLLLSPVLYVLSVAPVSRLLNDPSADYTYPSERLTKFYTPAVWLAQRPGIGYVLCRWSDVWGVSGVYDSWDVVGSCGTVVSITSDVGWGFDCDSDDQEIDPEFATEDIIPE